jgi:hypothetical protein
MKVGDLVTINNDFRNPKLTYYLTAQHSFNDIGIITHVMTYSCIVYWINKEVQSTIAKPILVIL